MTTPIAERVGRPLLAQFNEISRRERISSYKKREQ